MKIPASAIRPFEPHGLPKTYMNEKAVQILVTVIAKGILAFQLNGLVMSQVNSFTILRIQRRIERELTYGGLEQVSTELWLDNGDEIYCRINYTLGGKSHGTQSGYRLYE